MMECKEKQKLKKILGSQSYRQQEIFDNFQRNK